MRPSMGRWTRPVTQEKASVDMGSQWARGPLPGVPKGEGAVTAQLSAEDQNHLPHPLRFVTHNPHASCALSSNDCVSFGCLRGVGPGWEPLSLVFVFLFFVLFVCSVLTSAAAVTAAVTAAVAAADTVVADQNQIAAAIAANRRQAESKRGWHQCRCQRGRRQRWRW